MPASISQNPPESASVFISCSGSDLAAAKRLRQSLVARGSKVFLFQENLQPGDKWEETITKGLLESQVFLCLASQNSIKSFAVAVEVGMALAKDREIIPIIIDDLKPEDLPEALRRRWSVISTNASEMEKYTSS